MQINQYKYTDDLKYGDNRGHFIILCWKKWISKIFHLRSNLVVIALIIHNKQYLEIISDLQKNDLIWHAAIFYVIKDKALKVGQYNLECCY